MPGSTVRDRIAAAIQRSPDRTGPAFALAIAMRGQAMMDFPLCNKSFDLSYCGHDL